MTAARLTDLVVNREEGILPPSPDGHVATFELTEFRLGCPAPLVVILESMARTRGLARAIRHRSRVTEAMLHGAWG